MKTPTALSLFRRSFFQRTVSLFLAWQLVLFGTFTPVPASASPGTSTAVTVSQTYDGNGNITSRTDGNGKITQYVYDARNRLTSVDYPGGANPDITFTYDQNGNRTGMTDATGTTSYDYDLFERLIGIDYPDGGFVSYNYDNVGNITDLLYGNYKTLLIQGLFTYIQYTYDADNRISTVKNIFTNHTTSYTYDDSGNVSRRTLPNGVTCDHAYDADGRLTGVTHRKSDNSLIVGFSYALNAIGNRTSMTETLPSGPARVTAYTYDPLDRLDTVTYPDGRFVDPDYDSFGNRTKLTETIGATTTVRDYFYDSDSRLLSTTKNGAPEESFYYDQTGNLLQRVRVTDNRQINYVYDLENRLVRYFDGTNNVEYLYNGVGERIAKSVNGVRTNFINDPNRQYIQVLAETDSTGVASRVYEWGNELLNQEDITGATRNYYLHDSPMGSVRRLVDSGAAVVNSYEFDAFGKPTTKTEGVANDYQFHGEVQEEETSLVFLRTRYLSCDSDRFLTRDTFSPPPGVMRSLNPYPFASGSPVNLSDPTGMDPLDPIYGTFGNAFGQYIGYRISGRGPDPDPNSIYKAGLSKAISNGIKQANQAHPITFQGSVAKGMHAATPRDDAYKVLRSAYAAPASYTAWVRSGYSSGKPGGVALNKSASVLLDINTISGGTYDTATGQILLFGKADNSSTALPKMSLDDLAVAFSAVQSGSMPVVSIEEPVVNSPPEWPGRSCFTVRYGPKYRDDPNQPPKVLDLSSKTHFGWVMFDADRHMKCLGLGVDNRTGAAVSSSVSGHGRPYQNLLNLGWQYGTPSQVTTRFWFNPKTIEIVPSPDGKSMELKKAEMQLSTETMFSSAGQVESTPDAEYFSNWFTDNYDAIADEQITKDGQGQDHYIFKELKQLAAIVGVVKWIQDNNVPVDLSFLKNYTPTPYPEAMAFTPQTSVTRSESGGPFFQRWSHTLTITGGVSYCNDLSIGVGGNPAGLAAGALGSRPAENNLAWSFNQGGQNYNVSAVSVDRKEKDGGYTRSDVDARLAVQGTMPLVLGRYFDSFDVGRTMFGYGWTAQPYALQFKGEPTGFNLCGRPWEGYAEVNFNDRAGERVTKFVPTGMYDKTADPLHLSSRFDPNLGILVYSYETKGSPGQIFTDSKTRYTMRLENGMLLDFDLTGLLTRVEDRNGNLINYTYDAAKRLTSISQPAGRAITFAYDGQNRVSTAALPDSHFVTYLYDASSNLTSAQVDAPTGRKLQYAYDADHAITEVLDEAGNAIETRTFDAYGRVSATNQPGVATPIAQTFNLANRTSSASGPNGYSQAMAFDANYDPTTITDARANSENLTYNRYRDVITERKADQRTYQYYYDGTGRRMATVNPNGRTDITLFDINGNPTSRYHRPSDATFTAAFDSDHVWNGAILAGYTVDTTTNLYDAKGNLTKTTDANAHERNFGYDPSRNGNMVFSKDGRNKQTDFTYDGFSRRTRVKNQLNHQTDFTYDERDNLKRATTPLTIAAGGVEYDYNLKNQRTSVTTGDAGARHSTIYTYNARGEIASVTDPAGFLTSYTYDARGNLTQITHNSVVRFTYDYDGMNRLTATHYTGTAGGGDAAIVPLNPRGAETLNGSITISWQTLGDWTGNTSVTIQYSTNGSTWTNIATVSNSLGSYVWNTGNLASTTVQIRFIRTGDSAFHTAVTAALRVLNGGKYYVNDSSIAGDQWCTAAGQTYNGTTVTGLSPGNPVNSIQAIIDNYVLQPGNTIYVDTGVYSISNTIVITDDDAGTVLKPVTITGPTNGNSAVFSFQIPTFNSCLQISNNGIPGKATEGIVVEHLKFTGAHFGILMANVSNCTVRYNECYGNGKGGAAGQIGQGIGLLSQNGGNNTIEYNTCRSNGAAGGDGTVSSMAGGPGVGYGIVIADSSRNIVRFNRCYSNGGIGGAAGSANVLPGVSIGAGIYLQSAAGATNANQVTDNDCYENNALGKNDSLSNGGDATSFGVFLTGTTASNIERNTVHHNSGYGGRSMSEKGGSGASYGIYAQDAIGLIVTKNISYGNQGAGDYGSGDATDSVGNGSVAGIYLFRCQGAVVKNNLCYENIGKTWGALPSEPRGSIFSVGIQILASPQCSFVNNTLVRNNYEVISRGTNLTFQNASQAYIGAGSGQSIIKNNIFDAVNSQTRCIYVEGGSTSGITLNYNNFYVHGSAVLGYWNGTVFTLASWRNATGQDANSLSIDPKYYDDAAKNFHLASNSPVIYVGETLAAAEEDADGEARPADGPDVDLIAKQDIGYDEFVDSDGDGLADVIEFTVTHTNPNEPDSDFDGLPDGWEVANGLDPNSAIGVNGASGNPDGDAYTNLQEYLGGSNPQLASSVPPQPPVITAFAPAGSNLFILEQDSIAFSATASDANSDPISYSWRLDGVVKSTTNAWTFTTNDESSGINTLAKSYVVELRVTAGADTVSRQWTVVVNNRNRAPVLAPLSNLTVNAGDTITLNPSVSDPDNQNGVPGDNNVLTVQYTGFMTGSTKTVTAADAGLHTVTISVLDNGLPVLSQVQSIQILVFADSDHDGIPDDAELANGLNPNSAADASLDPDHDGLITFLEYAFGTNPAVANAGVITVSGGAITQRGGPTTWLQNSANGVDFRALFGRRKGVIGLTYTPQFSADLVTWESSVAIPTVLATDDEIEAVTVPYPFFVNGRKARFFRVQVTSP